VLGVAQTKESSGVVSKYFKWLSSAVVGAASATNELSTAECLPMFLLSSWLL
jgi:hypothetical protein